MTETITRIFEDTELKQMAELRDKALEHLHGGGLDPVQDTLVRQFVTSTWGIERVYSQGTY